MDEKDLKELFPQLSEDVKILSNIIYYEIINKIDSNDDISLKKLKNISELTIESLKQLTEQMTEISKVN